MASFRTATAWMRQGYIVARPGGLEYAWNPSDNCIVCRRPDDYQWSEFSNELCMEDLYAEDWEIACDGSDWDGWLEGELSSDFVLPPE